MKRREKASGYSRRRRGIRTRKNEMENKRSLMRTLLNLAQRPSEMFAGVRVPTA